VNLSRLVLVPALLVFTSMLSGPLSAQSEETFSSLEERMTGREFTESGLHKLDPEELEALNRWIRQRSLAEYEYEGPPGQSAAAPGNSRGDDGGSPPIQQMARETIRSRIVGTFSGWDGNTEFELENGMVWKQDERDRFPLQPVENPAVTVKPGILGSWRLSIEGHNRSVRVERIE